MKALILALLILPTLAHADVSVPRAKQYGWFNFDVSRDGGSSTAHTIGLALPAGAVISDVWIYINTTFVSPGTLGVQESIGVTCAGSQDVMAYTSISGVAPDRLFVSRMLGNTFNGAASLIPASPTQLNFSQGFGTVPAGCNVSVDVKSAAGYTPYSAGKLTGIIEYFRL